MRFAFALLLATPAFAAHSGIPKLRTGPELSDIALFGMAAVGVWLVRRAMRARFARRPKVSPVKASPVKASPVKASPVKASPVKD